MNVVFTILCICVFNYGMISWFAERVFIIYMLLCVLLCVGVIDYCARCLLSLYTLIIYLHMSSINTHHELNKLYVHI